MRELNAIIDKCFQESPQVFHELGTPSTEHAGLSMVGMPPLPGQQRSGEDVAAAATAGKRPVKKLRRADLGKIRGIDTTLAPKELRCAIDGRILGTPVRSPYGHVFGLANTGTCANVKYQLTEASRIYVLLLIRSYIYIYIYLYIYIYIILFFYENKLYVLKSYVL